MQSIGFIGPGIALLCLNFAKTPIVASILMTIPLSLSSFSQAGFLLNMQDIAPQYAGFLHVSTIGAGYFVQWLGSFQAFLSVTTCLYFALAIFSHTSSKSMFFGCFLKLKNQVYVDTLLLISFTPDFRKPSWAAA